MANPSGSNPTQTNPVQNPKFKNWWMTVVNYLGMNPMAFQDDQQQIRFVLGLMTHRKARDWAQQYYWNHTHDKEGNDIPWKSQFFEEFQEDIKKQFTLIDEEITA